GVINQLDADKANFEATLESIRAASRVKPVVVQYPVNQGASFDAFIDVLLMKMYRFKDSDGHREELEIPAEELEKAQALNKELVEMAAEHDEALMELYFDKGTLTQDDIRAGLKIGLSKREIMPIFCASGKRDIGTKRLMEFIINVAPGPLAAPKFLSAEGEELAPDAEQPAVAFVFKSQVEQHIGEISYFRVIRGKLVEGMELINPRTGNKEKISQLFAVAGKNRVKVTELWAGDIGCTVKLKGTRTNDTLCAPATLVQIEPISFPEPRYRAAIKTKDQADDEKLGKILNEVKYEDPTILVDYSKELKQTIIQGQGEHHLNILRSRIAAENKLQFDFIAPRIPYRETITKVAQADYRHKKQSGGAGQFGEVHLIIEPYFDGMPDTKVYKVPGKGDVVVNIKNKEVSELPWGGKLVFCNAVVGGAIDARFMPAILKGIMEKMDEGPLTGSYARDIRVVVYDGKMHPVDSNEISFKLAARNAFKEAFRNAAPKIMEPIYSIEVLVPSDFMGAVMSDLQNRRSMIEGMESDKGFDRLNARVPLSELYRYSTTLSSLTSGSATYSMKFASYEQVPADVQEKLLKAYTDTDEE
ncbi:MAG: elongation factor G, partial [Alistipes sp.]